MVSVLLMSALIVEVGVDDAGGDDGTGNGPDAVDDGGHANADAYACDADGDDAAGGDGGDLGGVVCGGGWVMMPLLVCDACGW